MLEDSAARDLHDDSWQEGVAAAFSEAWPSSPCPPKSTQWAGAHEPVGIRSLVWTSEKSVLADSNTRELNVLNIDWAINYAGCLVLGNTVENNNLVPFLKEDSEEWWREREKGRKKVDRARERREGRKEEKEEGTVITSCGNYSKGVRGERRYYTAGFGAGTWPDKPMGKICLGWHFFLGGWHF